MENMEEASLVVEVSLRADADCRRLARRNMVDTVEVIEGFLWREGVRVGSTRNWEDGRPCVDADIDASGDDEIWSNSLN